MPPRSNSRASARSSDGMLCPANPAIASWPLAGRHVRGSTCELHYSTDVIALIALSSELPRCPHRGQPRHRPRPRRDRRPSRDQEREPVQDPRISQRRGDDRAPSRSRRRASTPANGSRFPASARTSPPRSASSSRPAPSPITRSCSRSSRRPSSTCCTCRASGRRRSALLYHQLDIRTLDELEAASRDGRLRDAQGHGREEGGADSARDRGARTRRRTAAHAQRPTNGRGARRLRSAKHAPDADIAVVGSLRRGCETSGDLDILAAGAPPSLMDAFTGYRLVERVLAHGDTKSSVLLCGRLPGRPAAGAGDERRRRAAVLHRLEERTTSRCGTARCSAASS